MSCTYQVKEIDIASEEETYPQQWKGIERKISENTKNNTQLKERIDKNLHFALIIGGMKSD
jgi:F0F1-type ATP synthase delta subunit